MSRQQRESWHEGNEKGRVEKVGLTMGGMSETGYGCCGGPRRREKKRNKRCVET